MTTQDASAYADDWSERRSIFSAMREQYAWAAGLFEGEGCLTWRRQNEYGYPAASLTMTDEDAVRRFAEIVAVGKVTMPRKRENRKQQWLWRGFGMPVMQRLNETIGPYLCERRRAKMDEMLTFEPKRDPRTKEWLAPREFTEEGMAAMIANGHKNLQTHCKRGHEFTPENTIIGSDPHQIARRCRICTEEWKRTYVDPRRKKRAA